MDYRLKEIEANIKNSDEHICKTIGMVNSLDRGYCSKSIIDGLRTFVQQIAIYINAVDNGDYIHENYEEIRPVINKMSNMKGFKSLNKLHDYLQILASHYSIDEDASERAMLKYYTLLYDIRESLSRNPYNLCILNNLEDFPLDIDHSLDDYYSKIAEAVEKSKGLTIEPTNRFYVYSEKEFYVNKKKYYEIVLLNASDYASKFDRIVVFSRNYILPNYAIKASIITRSIQIFDKKIEIRIVNMWEVSIRGCEIAKFLNIMGKSFSKTYKPTSEYNNLMKILTQNECSINDLLLLEESEFEMILDSISNGGKNKTLTDALVYARAVITNKGNWCNTLRYLLFKMNNTIFRRVISEEENHGLFIAKGCYAFEKMPFVTSLPKHNILTSDLLECIDVRGREYELMVNQLLRKSTVENSLYFTIDIDREKYDRAIEKYNSKLIQSHRGRRIEQFNNYYYNVEAEEATEYIIKKLKDYENDGLFYFDTIVEVFNNEYPALIDNEEKQNIMNNLFIDSRIAIINGAAGTGKSTLLSYISKLFDSEMLVLCVTNTALNNLRDKLGDNRNIEYSTIASFIKRQEIFSTDLLIVDECSTVCNVDFYKVLKLVKCDCIVLAGDTYQIEAIEFGNWFSLAQNFIKKDSCHELTFVHRSANDNLKILWEKVRNCDDTISETINRKEFSQKLGADIFNPYNEDEVILCLNYNGLYGVNNVNNICQQMNTHQEFHWNNFIYKVGDPIIFNDSDRFMGYIKNNQKGLITNIVTKEDSIIFDVRINKILKLIGEPFGFDIVDMDDKGTTIRFEVYKETDYDSDSSDEKIVPFDVSYAISIHKAQGLEFDSVKIVITDEIEDRITHNIFYTAITRAKNNLSIYWSPEVQNRIISRISHKNGDEDKFLFARKYGIQLNGNI